jgi:hypothetical protein
LQLYHFKLDLENKTTNNRIQKLHDHCKRKQYILVANKDAQVKHAGVQRISRKITSAALSHPKLNFSSIGRN